jgi:DNA-binding transcriptional ArsR family regulator
MTVSEKRFTELLERVAALEERMRDATGAPEDAGGRSTPGSAGAGPDGAAAANDTFWALEELKRREPMPSVLYTGVVETYAGDPVQWQVGYHSTALLEEDWTAHAPAIAALGHPSRLRMLQLVARGEALSAADLAHTDGLGSTGQIYHHLRQLVAAGWLRSTTKGQHEVPPERLVPLLVVLAASR